MGGNQGNGGNDGDYYCDANLGNNVWCPEYDTWEGKLLHFALKDLTRCARQKPARCSVEFFCKFFNVSRGLGYCYRCQKV